MSLIYICWPFKYQQLIQMAHFLLSLGLWIKYRCVFSLKYELYILKSNYMTRIKYDTQEKSHMHFFPHFIFMLFYPFAQTIISYVRLHRDNIPHTLHFTGVYI